MIGLFGLLGLMLVGFALDISSTDEDDADKQAAVSDDPASLTGLIDPNSMDAASQATGDAGESFQLLYGKNASAAAEAGETDALADDTMTEGAEIRLGGPAVTIEDFDAAQDILVVYYDDPEDTPMDMSFTDNGGSGMTEVTLFGQTALRLVGNIDDIGLTADNIGLVNTAA